MDKSKVAFAVIVAILILSVSVVAVVVVTNNGPESHGNFEITDVRDRHITIPSEVNRVVCLSAGTVRLMSYFDAVDKIVGIDGSDACKEGVENYFKATYRVAYQEIKEIEFVGDESEASFRAIMTVNPQVIISSKESTDILDNLQSKTNIPVVAVAAEGSIIVGDETFDKDIRIIGKILGKEDRAEEIIHGVDAMIAELSAYASKIVEKPTAYVGGMFYMKNGGFTETSGKYISFDLAGISNVMPDVGGNPYQTDIKAISSKGEQYIFVDSMTYEQSKTTFENNRSTLSILPAVKENSLGNERMFSLFVWKYYGTNWESELMNAYFIGNVANPEVYDFDLDEKLNAVLSLFYPNVELSVEEISEMQGHGAEWLDW